MLPRFSFGDHPNSGTVDSVFPGEYAARSWRVLCANLPNLLFRQLSKMLFLSPCVVFVAAISFLVGAVGKACVPSQVRYAVIGAVIVPMAALFSFRAWPDECFQDEVMDKAAFRGRHYGSVPKFSCGRLQSFPGTTHEVGEPATNYSARLPARPDRSIAPGTIARMPWNVSVLDYRLNFSHGVNLLERFVFWSGLNGTVRFRPACFVLAGGEGDSNA